MKKLIGILVVVGILCSIWWCNFKDKLPDMYIQKAELTEQEEQLIKLLGTTDEYTIYDFNVDDKIKAIQINTYELKDGIWSRVTGRTRVFEDIKGRIALSFDNIAQGHRVAIQSQNESGSKSYDITPIKEYQSMGRATSFLSDRTEIIYEKEIPLVIQILTAQNAVSSYNVEYFYKPEEYEKHDYEHVFAITVMLSKKTVSEFDVVDKNK